MPGSHKTHGITKRFVRLEEGGTGFENIAEEWEEPREGEFKIEECPAGKGLLNYGVWCLKLD